MKSNYNCFICLTFASLSINQTEFHRRTYLLNYQMFVSSIFHNRVSLVLYVCFIAHATQKFEYKHACVFVEYSYLFSNDTMKEYQPTKKAYTLVFLLTFEGRNTSATCYHITSSLTQSCRISVFRK